MDGTLRPEEARVPNPEVSASRLADEPEKEVVIDLEPTIFFTEPHYGG